MPFLWENRDAACPTFATTNYFASTSVRSCFVLQPISPHARVQMTVSPSEFNNFVMQSKSLPPDKIWRITDIYNNSLIRPEGAANRSGKTKSASDKLKGDPNRAIITTTMDLVTTLVIAYFSFFIVAFRAINVMISVDTSQVPNLLPTLLCYITSGLFRACVRLFLSG